MAQAYETFMHRWFEEVWNQKNEKAIDEMLAEDGIAHGLKSSDGETIRGAEKYKELFRGFQQAFPDIKITVEDTVTEGDKIAARCRVTATHTGEGIGFAPSGQPVEFTGMTIVRIENDKIVEAWNEFDFMKMFTQCGALTLNSQ